MATLVRRGTDPYDSVPGMTQTDGSSNYQSTGSIPFSGTGGSSPMDQIPVPFGPYLPGSTTNYGGGSNPIYLTEAPSKYLAPSPLTDYKTAMQMYDKDTTAFGMLASFYGPNMRRAMDTGFQEMYGNTSGMKIGFGTNVGVNVRLDYDLPNKQAEEGSIAWLRKINQDLTPTNQWQAIKDISYATGGPTATSIYATALKYSDAINRGIDPNEQAYHYHNGPVYGNTSYQDPAIRQAQIDQAVRSGVSVTNSPISGWNKENVNTFGFGFGIASYNQNERLAPTYLSQGQGIFSSGTYHIGPSTNSMISANKWGIPQHNYENYGVVNGRMWSGGKWTRNW